MKQNDKKIAGIWIDHSHAYIISTPDRKTEGEYSIIEKVKSKHHADHSHSEYVHENKVGQELDLFFKELATHVTPYDSILLFGPGKAQEEFKNYLGKHKEFDLKKIALGASDHQTEGQLIEQVRMHFFHN